MNHNEQCNNIKHINETPVSRRDPQLRAVRQGVLGSPLAFKHTCHKHTNDGGGDDDDGDDDGMSVCLYVCMCVLIVCLCCVLVSLFVCLFVLLSVCLFMCFVDGLFV